MKGRKSIVSSLNDLKQAIIIIIIAVIAYFFGGVLNEADKGDFIAGIIVKVVDGDTAIVSVDGQDRRVRFLGVDTPETVHPNKPVQYYGKEASNFTKEALNGRRVWLEYDVDPQDKYKRHLAYIWLKPPSSVNEGTIRESMFNAKLLLGGYAKVMIIKPNRRYEAVFRKLENEARLKKLGIWGQ